MVFHHYGTTKTSAVLDKIKDQGFKYSTVSSVTIAISDIVPVDGKYEEVEKGQVKVDKINALYRKGMLSDKERHTQVVKIWSQVTDDVKKRSLSVSPMISGTRSSSWRIRAPVATSITSSS
jgi:DNA-directed RNA polymerase subunit beta'